MLQPNPRKTTSVRTLGVVDIAAIRNDVLAIPDVVWDFENSSKPNSFEVLDRTRHIVFRFISTMRDWRESYDRPLWNPWRSRLEPVLLQAVSAYGYARADFPRVMLARMPPGGVIHPHRDTGVAALWPHKIHVPIVTNDKVSFLVGDTQYHFPEGEAFEINNLGVHAARNDGDCDRIHLIFEYYDLDQPVTAAA
jgi:hypothetical protein